jgi:hypothetical protein
MQQIHLEICFFHIAKDTSDWKPGSGVYTPESLTICLNAGAHVSTCTGQSIQVLVAMYQSANNHVSACQGAHGPMAMYTQLCNHMLRAVYKYVHTPINHHAQNLIDASDPLLTVVSSTSTVACPGT